jgi:hypothetical protein
MHGPDTTIQFHFFLRIFIWTSDNALCVLLRVYVEALTTVDLTVRPIVAPIVIEIVIGIVIGVISIVISVSPAVAIVVNVLLTFIQAFANAAAVITTVLIAFSVDVFALASTYSVAKAGPAQAIIVTTLIRPGVVAALSIPFTVGSTLGLAISTKVPAAIARVGIN